MLLRNLAGLRVQSQVLSALAPNTPYDDSARTVAERLTEIAQRREALLALSEQGIKARETASDSDLVSFYDREKTIDKAVHFIEEAADKGAVIIGFPELFIAGHPDLWYLAKKSNPLHLQGELFKQLVKNGLRIPSPEADRLCAAAQKAHAYIVIGMSEVDNLFPGTLYNSQLIISDYRG